INGDDVIKAFINELELHLKVHFHNNILRFHGFCKEGNTNYTLIIEYADGGTLREELQNSDNPLASSTRENSNGSVVISTEENQLSDTASKIHGDDSSVPISTVTHVSRSSSFHMSLIANTEFYRGILSSINEDPLTTHTTNDLESSRNSAPIRSISLVEDRLILPLAEVHDSSRNDEFSKNSNDLANNVTNNESSMKDREVSRNNISCAMNEPDFTIDTIADNVVESEISGDVLQNISNDDYANIFSQIEFKHEVFHFPDGKHEVAIETYPKNSVVLHLNAHGCKDVLNLTDVSIDNNFLRFSLCRTVTCRVLKGRLLPATVQNIVSDISALVGLSKGPEPSLMKFDPVKNVKLIILDGESSRFRFNVPVGLSFKFRKFSQNKILFELIHNEISKKFFKRIQEEVVSRMITKIVDTSLEDDSFLYTRFIHFANQIYRDSREDVRRMILDMLARDHVQELEKNTHDYLSLFFGEEIIYLRQEGEEEPDKVSAFEVISQCFPGNNKNLIVKNVLDREQNQVWILDSIATPSGE
ncbi:15331_t:CDS:2, partial [Acaulospora morrowiae]